MLCEEAIGIVFVSFKIFCYGLLCDLRFVLGFLLEFVCDFLIFWFKVVSGGGLWCFHGRVMVFLRCDLWALVCRLFSGSRDGER